ncbi:MAG: DUF4382 domain-containing protein [Pseudomonadota bacterium]
MKLSTRWTRPAASAASLVLLAACGGGGSSSSDVSETSDGTLSLAITDAPVDNASEVWVQFTGVRVKPSDGPAIEVDFDSPMEVDLLELTGENSAQLLNEEPLPAGSYEWIALDVEDTNSYVVDDMGQTTDVRIPSGDQQGLRLVSGLTITAGQHSQFIIDWDLRKALTNPVGQSGYFLRPALRITDLTEHGSIAGTVADGLVMDDACVNDLAEDRGNLVYVFEGADADPVDIDGEDPEPLTTATVAADDQAAGAYTFEAAFLAPGEYTVAFTCQGLNDDPERNDIDDAEVAFEFSATRTAEVVNDETAEVTIE